MTENNNPREAQKTEEVLPRIPKGQLLLFPKNARELCRELGVQRSAIMKLFEDGLQLEYSNTTNTRC